tara:strand:+ start:632 stop:745 length:114 start_codon:yes stop_codon:yes gene_type:complete
MNEYQNSKISEGATWLVCAGPSKIIGEVVDVQFLESA